MNRGGVENVLLNMLSADLGQHLGYKVMGEHSLNTSEDREPIGLLICHDHDRIDGCARTLSALSP